MAMQRFLMSWIFVAIASMLNAQKINLDVSKDSLTCDTVISLAGVDVVARRATVKMAGNSLVVDVEHDSILNRQNNIYELLAKTPGIIRSGQSVLVAGKGAPVYYINGRKVKNQNVLNNLQVDQVKSIMVQPMPDANYDSSGAPVVDIKTKRLGEGLAFNTVGNLTQARHLTPTYGFVSTYSMKKVDFFLGYNYSNIKTMTKDIYKRQVLADTIWNKDQSTENLSKAYKHNFQVAWTYHPSRSVELGLQYDGFYSSSKDRKNDSTSIASNFGKYSSIMSDQDSYEDSYIHHLSAYYEASFSHSWHLSMVADYIHKKTKSNAFICEKNEGVERFDYDSWSRWNVASANIHLNHDFMGWGSLRLGYDFSHSQGVDGIDYTRSLYNGNTKNKEVKNALFVSYDVPVHNFSFSAGMRYENVFSKITLSKTERYHESTFMPTLSVSYSKGELMQSLSYSLSTNRANFADKNNNVIYVNRYEQIRGNENVKTELAHDISYMLMYKFLYATLGYSYISNPLLTMVYALPKQPSVTVSSQGNLSHSQMLSAMLNARHSIGFWSFALTGFLQKSFVHYPGANATMLSDGHPLCMINVDNYFQLPKGILFSLGYKQMFGGYLETLHLKPLSSLNLSVKKSFLHDKLRLSVDAYDIFNGDKNRYTRQMHNVIMDGSTKYETRKIGLTLTYRFRKNIERKANTSAETEMKRLGMKVGE